MTDRRSHRAPVPFSVVLVGILVAGGALGWSLSRSDDGANAGGSPAPSSPSAAGSPSAAAAGSPSPSPTSPARGTLVIHGTGDVSLDPSYLPVFRSRGYGWAWSGVGGLFRRDDLTVVNLECPATTVVAPIPKRFSFRCDPAALPAASAAGIEVANQSNNHAYDQGPQGLIDSLRNIRGAGISPIGAGADQAQALRPVRFDLHGWRVAVLGIDEVLDPLDEVAGPDKPGTAAGHDFSLALRTIRRASAISDLVVVMIHWGVELDTRPRAYQVEEAHRMVDVGADVIFGGHSHRLQPVETYRGRPIFYSLGNFVWPRFSSEGSTTAIAEVVIRPEGTIRGRLLPAEIVSDGHPVLR